MKANSRVDLRQQGVDSLVVLRVLASTQGIQADGAEHGTGVQMYKCRKAEVRLPLHAAPFYKLLFA